MAEQVRQAQELQNQTAAPEAVAKAVSDGELAAAIALLIEEGADEKIVELLAADLLREAPELSEDDRLTIAATIASQIMER